jgi:hypothetical protein
MLSHRPTPSAVVLATTGGIHASPPAPENFSTQLRMVLLCCAALFQDGTSIGVAFLMIAACALVHGVLAVAIQARNAMPSISPE